MLGKFYLEYIGKNGVPPDEDAFETYGVTKVRSNMSRADVMSHYDKINSGAKSIVDRVMKNEIDGVEYQVSQGIMAAFTPDQNGRLPSDPESLIVRSPNQLKTVLRGRLAQVYAKFKREVSDEALNTKVNTLLGDIRYAASQEVAFRNSKIDMTSPIRAVAIVDHAVSAGSEVFEAPVIQESIRQVTASPAVYFDNNLIYGVNMLRAFRTRGGVSVMEKHGFSKEHTRFLEFMDANMLAGKNPQDAAKAAATKVSLLALSSGAPKDRLTLAGEVVRDRMSTYFPWRSSSEVADAAPVLELYAADHATALLAVNSHMSDESMKTVLGKWVDTRLTVLENGSPFARPDRPPPELADDSLVSSYCASLTESLKKVSGDGVSAVMLSYDPSRDQYQVLVVPAGASFMDAVSPASGELEQLQKDGFPFAVTSDQLKDELIKHSIRRYKGNVSAEERAKTNLKARFIMGGS
jgi:hypothetical protein